MNIFKKIFGNNPNDKKEVITMTNTEKAIALINTFATGDTEKAYEQAAALDVTGAQGDTVA